MVREVEKLDADPQVLAGDPDFLGHTEIEREQIREAPAAIARSEHLLLVVHDRVGKPGAVLDGRRDDNLVGEIQNSPDQEAVGDVERLPGEFVVVQDWIAEVAEERHEVVEIALRTAAHVRHVDEANLMELAAHRSFQLVNAGASSIRQFKAAGGVERIHNELFETPDVAIADASRQGRCDLAIDFRVEHRRARRAQAVGGSLGIQRD